MTSGDVSQEVFLLGAAMELLEVTPPHPPTHPLVQSCGHVRVLVPPSNDERSL